MENEDKVRQLLIDWFLASLEGAEYVVSGSSQDYFNGLLDELKIRATDLGLDFPLTEVRDLLGKTTFERWPGASSTSSIPQHNFSGPSSVEHSRETDTDPLPVSGFMDGQLSQDDVEWVVNDNGELGVKIGAQFFFCYKGRSLVYENGLHDNGQPRYWRPVFKREFGECIHPSNYRDLTKIGTVSLSDSDEWLLLPAARTTR